MEHTKLSEGFEFETPGIDLFDKEDEKGFDDPDTKIDHDVQDMLTSWNKELFMREVKDDRDLIMRNQENKITIQKPYYDGVAKFDDLIKSMKPLEGDQVYIEIIESKPDNRLIETSDTIFFDRMSYLEGQELPYENSLHDGRPIKLNLNEGPILPGLLLAILSMRVGERANVIIRPSMAYGPLGCFPLIPADTSLFYNIKIFSAFGESPLESLIEYENANQTRLPTDSKIKFIKTHKDVANNFLRDGFLREALIRYKTAIKCMEDMLFEVEGQASDEMKQLMVTLLVNASIASNKLEMHKTATKLAKRALTIEPKNLKAYYQLILARIRLTDYERAENLLERVMKLLPSNDNQFDPLRLELDTKIRTDESNRRELYKKMARGFF